jgi:Zn-dependent M28 family amino/carboxypeptidase
MLTPLIALLLVQTPGAMTKEISADRMRATVEKLASFNTRNTNTPGLTEAAEWVAGEYRKIPGLQVEIMRYTAPKSRRVPEEKEVVQVIAQLPGEDEQLVMVGGHLDSVNLAADIQTGRAPGANDDASGTALALEIARVMSKRKWKHTLMFVAFSGEEQGLLGSTALAKRARAEDWKIIGLLSNDMVGNSGNNSGQKDTKRVRVFSEEAPTAPKPAHQSRELARYIEFLTRSNKDFNVKLVFRKDRFGRGGDHSPFNDQGFNAVRFVEVHEEYSRQHTLDDLPKYMDWAYLSNVARLNLIAMSSLANADSPPSDVRIDRRQGHDTTITWKASQGVKYVVYWRETTSPTWQASRNVGAANTATIAKVNKDDHVFAVGAEGGIPVEAK